MPALTAKEVLEQVAPIAEAIGPALGQLLDLITRAARGGEVNSQEVREVLEQTHTASAAGLAALDEKHLARGKEAEIKLGL